MRIIRTRATQKDGQRNVSVRTNDGRIYFVKDRVYPSGREVELMRADEVIGRYSKERGERINSSPIVVELLKSRILEEGWVK